MSANIVITSFYNFFHVNNLENIKSSLLEFCSNKLIKGTILIASEGINSTISGSRTSIDQFYIFIEKLFNKKFIYKESYDNELPFLKMKVKIKREIVTIGINDFDTYNKGEYIKASEWDEFISRDDVVLIDTRNNYEVALGSFDNSINPNTDNFRQLPTWLDNNSALLTKKKIAMFCTGGIRCEKSTSYLKNKGFDEVYHLEGGILEYFSVTKNKNNKWHGNCFVFDERMTVDSELNAQGNIYCNVCETQVTTDDIKRIKGSDQDICFKCFKV